MFAVYFIDDGIDNTINCKKKSKILDYFKGKNEENNEAVAHNNNNDLLNLNVAHENVHNLQVSELLLSITILFGKQF